jgi:ADP-ribose pyrophosphatase
MGIWETLGSRFLWQSRWYRLRQDRVRTQDGHEFTYTLVDHPGAVWIVPVTVDGQVILVWQYRDSETSGQVTVKSEKVQRALRWRFKHRQVHKTYLALLDGLLQPA